jgi:hypothetical protein
LAATVDAHTVVIQMPSPSDHRRRDTRNSRHRLVQAERLESRLALAAAPVNPNQGSIVASQFQPYGYSLLGTQLLDVTAGGGQSIQLTAPNNSGTPPAPPATFGYPQSPVNTGQITDSQVNVGGFTTLGMQLKDVTIENGALRVDVLDEGIGKPAAGGTQPVPVGGANTLPAMMPPGSPGGPANSGVIISSQFNDGGFGPLGIQASGLSVGGDLSVVSRTTLGAADVPVSPPAVPFAPPLPSTSVNTGTIRGSQFADGGFGDTGLQLRSVSVGGAIDVAAEKFVIQPTTGTASLGPPTLVGTLNAKTRLVTFPKAAAGSAPPTSMLYPGMFVFGKGIPAKTVVQSIVNGQRIMLSKLPRVTGARQVFFSAQNTGTNTGSIVSSQVADGGFGDIGLQWSNVTVGGRVATQHSGLQIQPGLDTVSSITTGQKQFGLLATPGFASTAPSTGAVAPVTPSGAAGTGTATGSSNDATNSGRIVASQFADGGFGDIGLQWQNVQVSGNVEATHNSLSVQPENTNQGLITVADVSFTTSPPAFTPSQASGGGVLAADPAVVTQGTPVSPKLPVPTNPGMTRYLSNSATNSGLVTQSQFTDGGFGDVGLQWSNVTVHGDVQVVHNALSIQPEGSNLAGVSVQNVTFGSASSPVGDPRLKPATLASLTVKPTGSAGPPPFVPNSAYARKANAVNRTNQQYLSSPAAATSLQWKSVTRDATGLVIVNNVLKVTNNGKPGKQPGAVAGTISLSGITFPGGVPPRVLSAQPSVTTKAVALPSSSAASGGTVTQAVRVNAATNSGTLSGNQFLDGGTGDIGLQWRDVTVNGSVRIEHNSCSINVVGDAGNTGPITVSGIRFDTGWAASGAASDTLYLTPATGLGQAAAATPAVIAAGGINTASNSATLVGGQFLDGGMGQVGLQWQHVTINCPIRIVNNVFSVTVSGTNTRGVSIQDVTFA